MGTTPVSSDLQGLGEDSVIHDMLDEVVITVKSNRYLGQTQFRMYRGDTYGDYLNRNALAHERLVKSNRVLMMGAQTVIGMAGEAQTLTNSLRNKTFSPNIVSSVSDKVKVGQWMTKIEYKTFMQTGIIPRSNVLSKGAQGFNDLKLTHYVEFRVHPNILKTKNIEKGWESVLPNTGPWVRLNKMKGNPIPEARGYDMFLKLIRTKN